MITIIRDATGTEVARLPGVFDASALPVPGDYATDVVIEADDVRAEAQRRIVAMTGASSLDGCLVKQLNAAMRATELVNKRALGITLTPEEEAEAAALQALADQVKAIRAASNAMEGTPPADFADDRRWPRPPPL